MDVSVRNELYAAWLKACAKAKIASQKDLAVQLDICQALWERRQAWEAFIKASDNPEADEYQNLPEGLVTSMGRTTEVEHRLLWQYLLDLGVTYELAAPDVYLTIGGQRLACQELTYTALSDMRKANFSAAELKRGILLRNNLSPSDWDFWLVKYKNDRLAALNKPEDKKRYQAKVQTEFLSDRAFAELAAITKEQGFILHRGMTIKVSQTTPQVPYEDKPALEFAGV